MGRAVNEPAPEQAWRVAALTMMDPRQLRAVLQGDDAIRWIRAAAACGIAEAQVRLGRLLLEGKSVARDLPAAFLCFQHAADCDDADGLNMAGRCFENGWGIEQDHAVAVRHYRAAADQGLDWAQYNLGHMLLAGSGVAQDHGAAFSCYGLAAAQGHARAMNLLGRCYEQGWGITRDRGCARSWYRRSALGGYFRGAYNYADMLVAEGCVIGASYWFCRAIRHAPESTLGTILGSLAARPHPAIRALAMQALEPQTSSRSSGRATSA